MDRTPEPISYERRFAHAWGARVVLIVLGLFFVLLFGFLPKVGPVIALLLLGGLGWLGFKTFVGARVKLSVFANGFRWEGASTLEGPWTALQDVRFSQANVLVSGVPVSHNMSLAVQLVSGEKFDLMTQKIPYVRPSVSSWTAPGRSWKRSSRSCSAVARRCPSAILRSTERASRTRAAGIRGPPSRGTASTRAT